MGTAPTVWLRALRPHTYMKRPIDVGDVYLAHEDHPQWGDAQNIVNIGFAVYDTPPLEARRPSVPAESLPPVPVETPPGAVVETTEKWPTPSTTSAKARAPRVRGARTIESIKKVEGS